MELSSSGFDHYDDIEDNCHSEDPPEKSDDYETQKMEVLFDMAELDDHFHLLKKMLYTEQINQVEHQLGMLKNQQLESFLKELQVIRLEEENALQVPPIWKQHQLSNLQIHLQSEDQFADQTFELSKRLLNDDLQDDLVMKVNKLIEDKKNTDIFSDLWLESTERKANRKHDERKSNKKRKPTVVTGPYVVYMLHESEILDDWSVIQRALRSSTPFSSSTVLPSHMLNSSPAASDVLYKDERMCVDGLWYSKGQRVNISYNDGSDLRSCNDIRVPISRINTDEIWVRRRNGDEVKITVDQLQRHQCTIEPASVTGH